MRTYKTLAFLLIISMLVSACITGQATETSTPGQPTQAADPTARAASANQPNILFILADDLDQKLGTLDYTPNLGKLIAEQGLTISDFFVTNSLCCPSRSTILRGQYTHSHTVYTNRPPTGGFQKFLSQGCEDSTIATWLQDSGYRTVLMGKYLNGYPEEPDPEHIPPGWTEWYSPSKGDPYTNYNYTLNENGDLVPYGDQPEDYLTDVLSDKAVDFIERAEADHTPFFMYIAPYVPHSPATPAPRHADLFPELEAPRTASFNEQDTSDKPGTIQDKAGLNQSEIHKMDQLYRLRVQSMQAVDEMIARLVEILEKNGQLDNTYIIFTSDNGFHMGQHGLLSGKTTAYEEDVLVPMFIRGPGIPAGETLSGYLAGNVDFAPTFADLTGIEIPDFVDGRSLVPLFSSSRPPVDQWRQAYIIEAYPNRETSALNPANETASLGDWLTEPDRGVLEPLDPIDRQGPAATYTALRTAHYKFIEYQNGERELYDLLKDPDELENLAARADEELLDQFSTWLGQLHACAGAECREIEQNPPPLVKGEIGQAIDPLTATQESGALQTTPEAGKAGSPILNIRYAETASGSVPDAGRLNLTSLDIYPPQEGSQHPIMIYVHGGGWRRGDKRNVDQKPTAFNATGYLFVSVNYRLLPDAQVTTQAGDVAQAVAYVHQHAEEYGGDPDKIFLMGHSAGAHLVSLVATDPSYLGNAGLSLKNLSGVVALDVAAYDIPLRMKDKTSLGSNIYHEAFGSDPEYWVKISPITYIAAEGDIPPFLVAYTGKQADRREQSELFFQKLQEAGIMAELLPAPEKTHAEINQELGAPGDAVTEIIFAFLNQLLSE
ncbi:MAG: sulfatase-like hydrolase/transferase [Anaerolineales bacterium]|nr:sulfatase-like hydrolase/transferase [Anaerolineales bacterium]